jgi:hypothetical protein
MADSNESELNKQTLVRRRRTARLFSIITVVSSCFLFAGAGCCFLTMLLFRPKVVDTPAGAHDVAAQILDWTLPADFKGMSGSTVDNPLLLFEIAEFAQQQGRGHLLVAQLQSKRTSIPDHRKYIENLVDQSVPELKKINVEEHQTRKLSVNGLPAEFQIGRGEDRASTTKYRQVIGHFRGKRDEAILILQFEDDLLTDKDIDDFLKSIK